MHVVNSGAGNFGSNVDSGDKLNNAASTLRFSILKLSRVFNVGFVRFAQGVSLLLAHSTEWVAFDSIVAQKLFLNFMSKI